MKYLKNFLNENNRLSVQDLEMCFDGFEDMGLHISNTLDSFGWLDVSGGSIKIVIDRKEEAEYKNEFKNIPFDIDQDIKDELISSIGKANEMGFDFIKIDLSSTYDHAGYYSGKYTFYYLPGLQHKLLYVSGHKLKGLDEIPISLRVNNIYVYFKQI